MPHRLEALARRLIEQGFNGGDTRFLPEVISPRFVEHQDFGPDHPSGAEGVAAVIASLRRAFPDFRLRIDDLAVASDVVWLRMTATGTHDGMFMGYAATGRAMRAPVFDALRVAGDGIVEHWGVPDRLAILRQLGLMPSRA